MESYSKDYDHRRPSDMSGFPKRRSRSRDRSRDKHKRRRYDDEDRRGSHRSGRGSASPRPSSSGRMRHRTDSSDVSDVEEVSRHGGSPGRRRSSMSRHERHRSRRSHRSRSRSPRRRQAAQSFSESPPRRSRKPLPPQEQSYRGAEEPSDAVEKVQEKQKPNFKNTGLLAAESNKVTVGGGSGKNPKSIVLKYNEPPEARKPPSSQPWVLYIFKGDSKDPIDTIPLHSRSCWLLGRETAVSDIPTEHPSCSKQHAVFQFRYLTKKDEYGESKGKVGLYLIDLESGNGTFLNGERMEPARYVECISGDVIKFGESEREYVLLLPPKG